MAKCLREWISRNERHLSAAVFLGGFVLDNIALGRIDLPWVEALYAGYLVAAALLILLSHYVAATSGEPSHKRPLSTLLTLGALFFLGGLLSGCLIFYARGAAWSVSWPFLLLLAIVFFASEFFHSRKERVSFQASLFFLALYLYAIFALPIALHQMNAWIFLASGLASAVLFAGFAWLLRFLGKDRFDESAKRTAITAIAILLIVNGAYFTGILPPLPLSLSDVGIYHGLLHTSAGYDVEAEDSIPAWEFWRAPTVRLVPGSPLYAYSAVFAPIKLETAIRHRWEYYDDAARGWRTASLISFSITGGRDGGYRGYSEMDSVTPGSWRVSIETSTGQVIGRERFTVVSATAQPVLHIENK